MGRHWRGGPREEKLALPAAAGAFFGAALALALTLFSLTALTVLAEAKIKIPPTPSIPPMPRYGDWTSAYIGGGGWLQEIVISPANPDRIYSYVDMAGIFRSDDGGETWRMIHGNIPDRLANLDTRAVHVDPRNADILIAAMSGSGIVEKNLATVYRSTDGGDTWTPRNEDLPANEPFFNENFWLYRGAEITADASGALFAVNNAKKKIHHRPPSENSRWKSVALPPPPLPPPAPRYLIAAADTARVGRFYVAFAGQSLWRTDNVGASWTQLYNGNIVSFALDRTRANQLALTSHEGILVSADAGATWRNLDAANALPYRPANHVLPLGDRVLAATSANGVFWKKINNNQNNRTIPR